MPVPRLTDATRSLTSARTPSYDRAALRTGVVHLGLGAFARAHLAVYLDDLIAAGHHDVGMLGVSMRHTDVAAALEPQDDLYTLGVIDGDSIASRIVGSVLGVLHAPTQPQAVRRALAAHDLRMISLTITEKGYCTDPATRRLDLAHPDVVHDLLHPEAPRSAPGQLLLAARDRRATGAPPITVLSLDNMPANGRVLRSVMDEMASAVDPSLSEWVASHMYFPCSMVDRMVPATDEEFRACIVALTGLDDAWPVKAEPYSQWVIERDWASTMPPLAQVGVTLVDDVAPWETVKLRVLNGLHTAAAHFGLRHGLATVDEVARDPDGRAFLDRLAAEIVEVLVPPSGLDVDEYVRATFARFTNAGLRHQCAQIATDTSQKIPQRLLGTLRERLARDLPIDALAETLALWVVATPAAKDPLATLFAEIAQRVGSDPVALAAELLSVDRIFGDLAGDPRVRTAVTAHL